LVLVVDTLEQLTAPTGSETELFACLKELYFNDPARLKLPPFSVVYSAPPSLPALFTNVAGGYTQLLSLTNFKVMQKPPKGDLACAKNQTGLDQMVQMVAKHFPDWAQALSKPVIEHLAWLSGGNARRFMRMLRTTVLKASLSDAVLPVALPDAEAVRQAISAEASSFQWLTGPDRKWLKHIMANSLSPGQDFTSVLENVPEIIRLFDNALVLDYQNGDLWYQVPPLVRDYL
jgi:hypothetical protein